MNIDELPCYQSIYKFKGGSGSCMGYMGAIGCKTATHHEDNELVCIDGDAVSVLWGSRIEYDETTEWPFVYSVIWS